MKKLKRKRQRRGRRLRQPQQRRGQLLRQKNSKRPRPGRRLRRRHVKQRNSRINQQYKKKRNQRRNRNQNLQLILKRMKKKKAAPQVKTNLRKPLKRVSLNPKSNHCPRSIRSQPRLGDPRRALAQVRAGPMKVRLSTRERCRLRAWQKLPRVSRHWLMQTIKNGRRGTRRRWLAMRHG